MHIENYVPESNVISSVTLSRNINDLRVLYVDSEGCDVSLDVSVECPERILVFEMI